MRAPVDYVTADERVPEPEGYPWVAIGALVIIVVVLMGLVAGGGVCR